MALKTDRAKPGGKPTRKPAAAPPPKQVAPAPDAKAPASPPVTLKHLAAKLTDTHGIPKQQAEAIMDEVIGLFVAHLKAGDRLRIAGLGILEVKHRPARRGRNPATGATIQIAASKKIVFRPGKELKAAVLDTAA